MKKITLVLMLSQYTVIVSAQSQGPGNPSSFSYSYIGCLSCPGAEWQNMPNISVADNMYSDVQLASFPQCFQSSCYYSRYLYAFNFGFTIPQNAVITGVEAQVLRKSSSGTGVTDSLVQLFTGMPVGSNHAFSLNWTPNPMSVTYGSSTDIWNYTLAPDTINSSLFGLSLMVLSKNFTTLFTTASIDHISITVYYNPGTGILSQTRNAKQISLNYRKDNNVLTVFNPAQSKINSIKIADCSGRTIVPSSQTFTKGTTQKIILPHLNPGIYFSSILFDGFLFRKKFIVE